MSEKVEVEPVIGLIGGSGLYDIEGLEDKQWRHVNTPWGTPHDELLFGRLEGVRCVFLPRHGRGHRVPPSQLNYRANIAALKISGVTDIISLSAVGSLKEALPPGHFVIVDQLIDRTSGREKSFFDTGCVNSIVRLSSDMLPSGLERGAPYFKSPFIGVPVVES